MSLQHTVVFRLVHPAGSTQEQEFLETAHRLLTGIPGVTEFAVNRQVSSKSDLEWQFSMVFVDQAAYEAYNDHAVHQEFVATRWVTEVESHQEYDFESHPLAGDSES
ncbi:Dabb family protein [Leucobacter japonicus]|uniref:Dabb family protein n=1 Tax=Leucobacter japonicus TaxID=1461259 RepID=UPI0006A79966|nr:Dabb family protein [Leucobacter japonicus]